jgi:hypothetical protein
MMEENDLKQLWLGKGNEPHLEINNDILMNSLTKRMKNMEKQIRRRDYREIIAAICLIPLFTWWSIIFPQWLAKAGCMVIAATCVFVIITLGRARKVKVKEDISSEMKMHLITSRQLLLQQIRLLNSVVWWYLLPFFAGVALFNFGTVKGTVNKILWTVIIAGLYAYIYYLNKRAVKKHLLPMEETVSKMLRDLSDVETASRQNGDNATNSIEQ